MTTLKEQKEAFVTGHDGTIPGEILLVCSSGIIGYWLYSVWPEAWIRPLSTEVILFWIPMVLAQSNLLYPWGVLYLSIEVLLAVFLERRLIRRKRPRSVATNHAGKHGALTMHRYIVMYYTFIAILAVDFPLFPRRFAKTETRGYSLMDVGAASFAFLAGLASSRARQVRPRSWTKEIQRMLPLIFMGSLRLLTHQELEYQEHVSEYGVHWNFFYTLAILGPVTTLLPGPTWVIPLLLMMTYQYFLSNMGLQTMIEDAPRKCQQDESSSLCHLFMANREGILGCIGYIATYLIGEWIGSHVLWNQAPENTIQKISEASVVVVLLWRFAVAMGIPVSRRSTNVAFVLWTLVVNLPLSTIILVIHQRHGRVTFLAHLIGRHGLACFVVANLLTGVVNLTTNTLEAGNFVAIAILLAYLTAVSIFVILLDWALANAVRTKQT